MSLEEATTTHKKDFFVLSEGGKPILSSYTDDDAIMVTSGLLQAMAGIAIDSGDKIKSFTAGNVKIVYIHRNNIYLVVISTTQEPEALLQKQLSFIYEQIIFVLTSKIHGVLENNPSKDMRHLIGDDTISLISSGFHADDLASPSVALTALESCTLDSGIRDKVVAAVSAAVVNSLSIAGLLLCKNRLVAYYIDTSLGVSLSTNDLVLLSHFVAESKALRYHDENWVPICLPDFNPDAFLQAYISHFIERGDDEAAAADGHREDGAKCEAETERAPPSAQKSDLALVLLSADHENFRHMHAARAALEKKIRSLTGDGTLPRALLDPMTITADFFQRSPLAALPYHCILKYESQEEHMPAQIVVLHLTETKEMDHHIWAQHMRHAVCMRVGSSIPESSVMKSPVPSAQSPHTMAHARAPEGVFSPERPLPKSNMPKYDGSGDCLRMQPASDYALSYTALHDGAVCVSVASSDTEMYLAFPNTLSTLEACRTTQAFSKILRPLLLNFFQL